MWFESRGQLLLIYHGVVACLGFGRRDVADRLQQPAIVEPVDPSQCRELDGLEAPPRSVDRFGESIVVAVADAADGRLDTGLCKPLGISNADVLADSTGRRNGTTLGCL